MKEERHKRKEYYSILVVSNINKPSRQFYIARASVRLIGIAGILFCGILAGYIGYSTNGIGQAGRLRNELSVQTAQIETLEQENKKLTIKTEEMQAELAGLDEKLKEETGIAEEPAEDQAQGKEPIKPGLYPSSGVGSLTATYSDDHPYISIGTYHDGKIIAAGDGRITAVGSDNTYKYIIEIEHGDGYKTRYFYSKTADLKIEEGADVKGGDVLLVVSEDGVDLDYQVLQNDEPIDPFLVIDAEG